MVRILVSHAPQPWYQILSFNQGREKMTKSAKSSQENTKVESGQVIPISEIRVDPPLGKVAHLSHHCLRHENF